MSLTIAIVLAGVFFFVGVFSIALMLATRRPNLGERLGETQAVEKFDWVALVRKTERIFKPLGEMIPRSPEEMTRQEQRFTAAGIRRKDAPYLFYGVKLSLAVVAFIGFTISGRLGNNPVLNIAVSLLVGAMIPDVWLSRTVRLRKERIQIALPDMLDLTVVSVEAGLGLDHSLMRISEELSSVYPDLSEELKLYSLEVNAGRKRADALRNLGNRTQVDDLKGFVAVLIQTDRFGTGIAQSLRVFADTMRTKRRQRAEEHAAKMSIKMIPPLVFFIFPAIWAVVLGPAIIQIVNRLIPGLSGR
jgi:tight adherence protein C